MEDVCPCAKLVGVQRTLEDILAIKHFSSLFIILLLET